MKDERAKDIERLMRLTWSSLESHLAWTHSNPKDKSSCKVCKTEDSEFHKQCIKDYSETMALLSKLY